MRPSRRTELTYLPNECPFAHVATAGRAAR